MNQKSLGHLLSRDPNVAPYLRGIYSSIDEIESFSLYIDLNDDNLFIYKSSDGSRWICLDIGRRHSYHIDCLGTEPEPAAMQALTMYATNGFSKLPSHACIAENSNQLLDTSAYVILYFIERICSRQTRLKPLLKLSSDKKANERLFHSWFETYKKRQ